MSVCCAPQDVHTEAPLHLLRLRVEAEREWLMGHLQECRAELDREEEALPTAGSERLIREHRVRGPPVQNN